LELQSGERLQEYAKTFELEDQKKHFRENLEWLKTVFKDGFEVVKELLAEYKTLGDNFDRKEVILQDIEMELCKIDYANDFCKIGGLDVMLESLKVDETFIKANVCWVIGTIAQNNPTGQNYVLGNKEILETLVEYLKTSNDSELLKKKKIVYAVSGLIKKNNDGLVAFRQLDGFKSLLEHLTNSKNESIRSRILFLFQQIIINYEFVDIFELIDELIPILLSLIYDESINLSISAVGALHELAQKGDDALTKLRENNLLLDSLSSHKERLEISEGNNYEEETSVVKQLLERIEISH